MSDGVERVHGFDTLSGKCRHGWHHWPAVSVSPEVLRAVRAAGIPTSPDWYVGPTWPAYCDRCGEYRDQQQAKQRRERIKTLIDSIGKGG